MRPGPSSPPAPGPGPLPAEQQIAQHGGGPGAGSGRGGRSARGRGARAIPTRTSHRRSRSARAEPGAAAPRSDGGCTARRGTARVGSAAPRGATARSSGPPARSEAAPRDSPRGGAAVRRRGAGRAAGSAERGARSGRTAMELPGALQLGELAAAFASVPVFPLFDAAYFIVSVLYLKYEPGQCGPALRGAGNLRSCHSRAFRPCRVLTAPCRAPVAAALPALGVPFLSVVSSVSVAALLYLYSERPQLNAPLVFPVRPRSVPLSLLAAPGAAGSAACCASVPAERRLPRCVYTPCASPCSVDRFRCRCPPDEAKPPALPCFGVPPLSDCCAVQAAAYCSISAPCKRSAGFSRPDPLQLSSSIKF